MTESPTQHGAARGSGGSSHVSTWGASLPSLSAREDSKSVELRSAAASSIGALWLGGAPDWSRTAELQLIRRELIVPSHLNRRQFVDRQKMHDLLSSIEAGGIHTPLDVSQLPDSGRVLCLSGHRRLWVATQLQLDVLPCRLDPRGILGEVAVREALIRYNENQEPPAPIDRARSVAEYIAAAQCTQAEAARRLGIDAVSIAKMVRILTLPNEVLELINTGRLPFTTGVALLDHPDGATSQRSMAIMAVNMKLPTREVQRLIRAVHGPRESSSKQRARTRRPAALKVLNLELPGSDQITIQVSSDRAEMTVEQMRAALTAAIDRIPVELVHVQKGDESPRPTPSETSSPLGLRSTRQVLGESLDDRSESSRSRASLRELPVVAVDNGRALRSIAAESLQAHFFNGRPDWSKTTVVQLIRREQLIPHPANPRRVVNRADLELTLSSIRSVGMHTPLVIAKHPEDPARAYVLGGHRRLFCATQLGAELIPCRLDPRVLSPAEVKRSLICDNEGQERPAPIDRARSFAEYLAASDVTMSEASARLGVNLSVMSRLLRLLELPEEVQEFVNRGRMSESVAQAVVDCPVTNAERVQIARRALRSGWTAAQVKRFYPRGIRATGSVEESDVSEGTDRSWRVLDDLRIDVGILCPTRRLSHSELTAALEMGREQITESERANLVTVESTAALHLAGEEQVSLSAATSRNSERLAELFSQFLPDHLVEVHGDKALSRGLLATLTHPLKQDVLKSLDLCVRDDAVARIRRFHHMAPGDSITLVDLLEYWFGTRTAIQELPRSQQKLAPSTQNRMLLDTPDVSEMVSREKVIETLTTRLNATAAHIARVETMRSAAVAEARGSQHRVSDERYSRAELEAHGVCMHPLLFDTLAEWRRRQGHSGARSPVIVDEKLKAGELEQYFLYAIRRVFDLTKGKGSGLIGSSQLREALISYSGLSPDGLSGRFPARRIIAELQRNLRSLRALAKSTG